MKEDSRLKFFNPNNSIWIQELERTPIKVARVDVGKEGNGLNGGDKEKDGSNKEMERIAEKGVGMAAQGQEKHEEVDMERSGNSKVDQRERRT